MKQKKYENKKHNAETDAEESLILAILDSAVKKARENIEKKGMITLEEAIPLLLRGQYNHIAHLEKRLDEITERINDMATKDDIKNMATKDDIKNMATKDDIKNMATKDDIADIEKRMATKDDIKNMATKDDIKAIWNKMATKDDIELLKNENKTIKWIIGIGLGFLSILLTILTAYTLFVK